jgi:PPOX class probable F420-dependent enzyme
MADEQQLLDLIAAEHHGVLAVVKSDGFPHMSNVLYLWDAERHEVRITTTADRVKGRVLSRDPHAALHVAGDHFWAFAVGEGEARIVGPTTSPGDEASRELLELYTEVMSPPEDEDAFFEQMIEARRLVVHLHVTRVYGVLRPSPPR